jgi:cell division protein FtsA
VLTRTKTATRAGDVVGVLDIGTSKTVCLIVAAPNSRANGLWRREGATMLGFGHRPSRGLKAGAVIDLDGAEQTLRNVVHQAEQMAGLTLEDVLVAVTCGRLKSIAFEAETRIEDRVRAADTERLMAAGRRYAQRDGHSLLHINQVAYRLDGAGGVTDPAGMAGTTLAADLHAVTAEDGPLRNLLQALERAYLFPSGIVPAPYASGLAATTEEERRLGVACVDIGAGATTISMFAEGQFVWTGTVAVGGQHVTFDIARALSVPFAEAERIKTLYGALEPPSPDDEEAAPHDPGLEPSHYEAARTDLHDIVVGRMSDLLARVADSVERSGVAHLAGHRVVVTGGVSQLPGLGVFAQEELGRPVRIGRPKPMEGAPSFCSSPQFSTAFGLVRIALDPSPGGVRRSAGRGEKEGASYLQRVGQWLREGF